MTAFATYNIKYSPITERIYKALKPCSIHVKPIVLVVVQRESRNAWLCATWLYIFLTFI